MNITAILCHYNRPHTIDRQIESIKNQTVPPKDIMLWYNKGEQEQLKSNIEKSVYCNYNFKFFGRFAFAFLAQTEYIAIFDDDTIPGSKWFENCLETMKTHEGILGGSGVILQDPNNYLQSISFGTHKKSNEVKQVDLVGHAWFFKKEWLKYMWMEEPFSYENGEDIHFSYVAQKYGDIQTYVPPHPENQIEMWGSIDPKLGSDSNASYKLNKNHYSLRTQFIQKYINTGWKLVN